MGKKLDTNLTYIDGKLYARVNYQDPRTGKWKSKYKRVQTQAEGRRVAVKLREEYGQITPEQLDAAQMTFAQLLDRYPKPLPKWYTEPARNWFDQQRIQTITYQTLKAYREHRLSVPHKATRDKEVKKPRAISTINREMEIVRRLLTYAHRQGWITRNPFNAGDSLMSKAEENHRDRIPTDAEITRLLEHATGPRRHLRPLIIAALDTGLRKGKLLSLKRPQIDLENRVIDLGRPVVKNKKHPRFVGLTERLTRELEAWLDEYKPPADEPIFGIATDFKKAWATLCQKAKVTDLHFHDLRHWYVTHAILAGLPKDLVMKQAGHTEEKTFDRYLNIDANIARYVAETLSAAEASKQQSRAPELASELIQ